MMERCTVNNLSMRRLLVCGWVVLLVAAGCGGSAPSNPNGRGNPDGAADGEKEAPSDVACPAAAAPRKTPGPGGGCGSGSDSGFSVDGVSCPSASPGPCTSAARPGREGHV